MRRGATYLPVALLGLMLASGAQAVEFDPELPFGLGSVYDDGRVVKQEGATFLCDVKLADTGIEIAGCASMLRTGARVLDESKGPDPLGWTVAGRGIVKEQEVLDALSAHFAANDCVLDVADEEAAKHDLILAAAIWFDMDQAEADAAAEDLVAAFGSTIQRLDRRKEMVLDNRTKTVRLPGCEG